MGIIIILIIIRTTIIIMVIITTVIIIILKTIIIKLCTQVLVIGAGPIGLLAAQCAKALGKKLIKTPPKSLGKKINQNTTKSSW